MAKMHTFGGVETTTFVDDDGALVGIYRGTEVAKRNGNEITLRTGGWKSNTTKTRMNQFSNNFCHGIFGVFQKNHEWFVTLNGQTLPFVGDEITFTLNHGNG